MKTLQNQEFNMEQFVNKLKREDSHYLSTTKSFKWIMLILSPMYFLFFLLRLKIDNPRIDQFGFLFFSLGFLSFALLLRRFHQEYKNIDYGVPMMEMLRKAASRHALWQTKTYLAIVPALLCAIGFSFSAQRVFPFASQEMRIHAAFGSILLVIIFSVLIGYFVWRKRQKPLRDQALNILREMGE